MTSKRRSARRRAKRAMEWRRAKRERAVESNDSHTEGCTVGCTEGFSEGFSEGCTEGFSEGCTEGYTIMHAKDAQGGWAEIRDEILDEFPHARMLYERMADPTIEVEFGLGGNHMRLYEEGEGDDDA